MTRPALLVLAALAAAPIAGHADPAADATAEARPRPKASWHRLYVRLGVAHVHPLSSSREMELADIDGPASLALKDGPIAGSGVSVGSSTIPAVIIGYVLPVLHDRLSIETILGPPLDVKFTATGTLANKSLAPTALGIPTGVMPLGPQLGEATGVPPVITAVYALRARGPVIPYAGGGLAMLFAYNAKATNPVLTAVSQPQMSISPAPGLALQAGIDARIWHRVYARIDVKYIAFMLARAEVHHIEVKTPDLPLFDTVEVGTAKMSVWVNPLIIQAGIGTDF